MPKTPKGMLAKLSCLPATEKSAGLYDEWAPDYERDLVREYGYESPQITTETFARVCPDKEVHIIDFGCGTGLVGQELAARGYLKIDGLDISYGMLEEAQKKGVYENLLQGDLTDRIGLADGSYDAAICVNSFGGGHVGPEHLGEMIRTVKPGGIIVFYINGNPYAEDDYPSSFQRLQDAGVWEVERTECSNYMRELDRPGWVVVSRRTAAFT